MKDYYVYAYLHPAIDVDIDVDVYTFTKKPFYIGKGKGNRMKQSFDDVMKSKSNNTNMINEVKDIRLFHGKEPILIKVMEDLTEKQAFILESFLIDTLDISKLSNRINGRYLSLLESDLDIIEMLELTSEL